MEEVKITVIEGSVARFLVREQLAGRDFPNDAVGVTTAIEGTIVFSAVGEVRPERSKMTVDLQSLKSDEDRRDRFIKRNTLESDRFPLAEFEIRAAPGLTWPIPTSGDITFDLIGNMTVHGVTKPLRWTVEAQFSEGLVTGVAKTNFEFGFFDMDVPSVFIVLSVEDNIRLEVDLVATIDLGS